MPSYGMTRHLAVKPDKHEAMYNKGVMLHHQRKYSEAIAEYDKALAVMPDYHEAMYNKGLALKWSWKV